MTIAKRKVEECKNCPLYNSRGPEESYFSNGDVDVIFLGEAPGASSILRTKSIKAILSRLDGLGIKSFGVMDTVRCYYSSPEKIQLNNVCGLCKVLMTEDLSSHRCRVVVPFGAVALNALMGRRCVTKDHGKLFDIKWNGLRLLVFPLLHPELVSIEPYRRKVWEEDLVKLREVLNDISIQR